MTINDVEMSNMENSLVERAKRLSMSLEKQERFLATLPQTCDCEKHPGELRPLDREMSHLCGNAKYSDCPRCVAEAEFAATAERLHHRGVPGCLLHASLDNWNATSEQEKEHLAKCREFAKMKRGFLLLLGGVGSGKSHLAVGIMREIKTGYFIKQSTLLRNLRETYHNPKAAHPIDKCQETRLLILDEMGVSSGGKDELPMLHEILDHRYSEAKQTIITSNLDYPGVSALLGERLADRFNECFFAVLTFGGQSHRKDMRDRYFTAPPAPVNQF